MSAASGLVSRRRLLAAVGLLALLALAVPFAQALGGPPGGRGTWAGEPAAAPALRGETLDGDTVDLTTLRGNVVLVNVWASWCAPCRREMPVLREAAQAHGADGLRVLGINSNDRRDDALRFLDEIGGSGPVRHVHDPDGRRAVDWGARGVPETFVVDRRGRVVDRHFGEVTRAWLEDSVLPRLGP